MLKINANSKINLFLEITGKKPNGYHTVDTVMQSVSLSDELELELIPKSGGIMLSCSISSIPVGERNIAYKTAKSYIDATGVDCGLKINIEKRIPSEAGMGGGSADGAAVLVGLNELCGRLLEDNALEEIAAKHGADIPFCLGGGTQRLMGIGSEAVGRYVSPELPIVIVKPNSGVSTPQAYRCLDNAFADFSEHQPIRPDMLIDALSGKSKIRPEALFNRFELALDKLCPASKELIDYLRDKSHGSLLCGSGAAVFAIADSCSHAKALACRVKSEFQNYSVWTAETVACGCSIL